MTGKELGQLGSGPVLGRFKSGYCALKGALAQMILSIWSRVYLIKGKLVNYVMTYWKVGQAWRCTKHVTVIVFYLLI